ncbi:hypothetical protein [Glaciibacter flavus]|uniref:hypothetical protein n=1 Tax=Orlajensenia flava TaxID=2565934 RepID=UPI003B002A49
MAVRDADGGGAAQPAPPVGAVTVSGGGATTVLTDELETLAFAATDIAQSAEEWTATIGTVLWLASRDDGGHLAAAHRAATAIADDARAVAVGLRLAGEAYGATERGVAAAQESAAGVIGWLAGFFGRVTVPVVTAAAAWASVEGATAFFAWNGIRRLLGEPPVAPEQLVMAARGLYTDPFTASLLRLLVSSVDDAGAGAVGLPLPVARVLSARGLTGVSTSAFGVLVGAGMIGALRDRGTVDVRQVSVRDVASPAGVPGVVAPPRAPSPASRSATVPSPGGVGDLLERVPAASDDSPQVRIERFDTEGRSSWAVYIGGTAAWDLTAGEQPWDLTSDVEAMAGRSSASYDAVVQAMQQAGVQPGDPVLAVGHSQGGLLAAQLASDDRFSVGGIVTAGAPIASADVPSTVAVLQLEHTDDVIPALAGATPPDPSAEHLMLRREYLNPANVDVAGYLPAHDLDGYRQTAALVDASADPRVQRMRDEVVGITSSRDGEASWWIGERTMPGGRG